MLSIEEYIARRKKEDKLNEFDIDARAQNMKICVDYVILIVNLEMLHMIVIHD